MKAVLAAVAALCLVASLPVVAQPNAMIDTYMEKAGLVQLLAGVEANMLGGIDQVIAQGGPQAPKLSADQLERLRSAVKTVYGADRLRESVRANLVALLPEGDTEVLLKWLETPLGKRVAAVELEASTPAGSRRAAELGAKTYADVSAARKADLERMVKTSGAVDASATVELELRIGIARGMAAAGGARNVRPMGESEKYDYRRKNIAAATKAWLMNAAGAYAPLSDDELSQYAAILERASMRRVLDATGMALERSLSSASTELVRQIDGSASPKPIT